MHFTINLINNCRRNFRTFFHETAFLAKNARFSCPSAVDIYPLLIYALLNNAPKLCVCASHIFYYFLFLLHVYKNTSCLFSFLQDSLHWFSPTGYACSHFFRCTEATNTASTVGKFLIFAADVSVLTRQWPTALAAMFPAQPHGQTIDPHMKPFLFCHDALLHHDVFFLFLLYYSLTK